MEAVVIKAPDGVVFVARVGLIMVQLVAQYCQLLDRLPSYAPELLTRLVELLKLLNSRCCQLILGAGALQLVGLKTISARNLGSYLALWHSPQQLGRIAHLQRWPRAGCSSSCTWCSSCRATSSATSRPASAASCATSARWPRCSPAFLHFLQPIIRRWSFQDYEDHIDELFNKLLSLMESQVAVCFAKVRILTRACIQHVRHNHSNMEIKDAARVCAIIKLQKALYNFHIFSGEVQPFWGGSMYSCIVICGTTCALNRTPGSVAAERADGHAGAELRAVRAAAEALPRQHERRAGARADAEAAAAPARPLQGGHAAPPARPGRAQRPLARLQVR